MLILIQPQAIQQQLINAAQRPGAPGIVQSQGVPRIGGQVNISQQQRIGTPSMPVGNPRLSPQQLLQVQQARAAAAQQQTQQQVQAQGSGQPQAQNPNINGSLPNGSHLPAYINRDTASSPAHVSPPHASATPANIVASPRPPSAQAHPSLQAAQVPGNNVPRLGTNNYYGLTGIQGIPGIQNLHNLTHEQIHNVLRIQLQVSQHNTFRHEYILTSYLSRHNSNNRGKRKCHQTPSHSNHRVRLRVTCCACIYYLAIQPSLLL
jgi:hypothetical protein